MLVSHVELCDQYIFSFLFLLNHRFNRVYNIITRFGMNPNKDPQREMCLFHCSSSDSWLMCCITFQSAYICFWIFTPSYSTFLWLCINRFQQYYIQQCINSFHFVWEEWSVWSLKISGFIHVPTHFQMKTQVNIHNLHVVVSSDKTLDMFSVESCLQPGKLWVHGISPGNNSQSKKMFYCSSLYLALEKQPFLFSLRSPQLARLLGSFRVFGAYILGAVWGIVNSFVVPLEYLTKNSTLIFSVAVYISLLMWLWDGTILNNMELFAHW